MPSFIFFAIVTSSDLRNTNPARLFHRFLAAHAQFQKLLWPKLNGWKNDAAKCTPSAAKAEGGHLMKILFGSIRNFYRPTLTLPALDALFVQERNANHPQLAIR
jgi:hypothetical protein